MLSSYAKENGWLDMHDHKKNLFDEFGNRISIPVVEYYEKNSLGEWVKSREAEEKHNNFVINGQLYQWYVGDDCLMPLNMDFDSLSCHACYKVVGEVTEFKRITGNTILYSCPVLQMRLERQSYSDGTCFYSLIRTGSRYANVNECGDDLHELVECMKRYNEIDAKSALKLLVKDQIEARNRLIAYMEQIIEQEENV
jgi:hypothetical protein